MCDWQPMSGAPNGDYAVEIDIWDGHERKIDCCWMVPDNEPDSDPGWCYPEYERGWGWTHYRVGSPILWMQVPKPPAS